MNIRNLIYISAIFALIVLYSACKDDDKPSVQDVDEEKEAAITYSDDEECSDDIPAMDASEGGSPISDSFKAEESLSVQQQVAMVNILKVLAGIENVPTRFDQETYEPVYGISADPADPQTRAVLCESVDEADVAFRSIVGNDNLLTTTPDGYSLSLKNMPLLEDGNTLTLGTLTFHRGDGASEMGYVVVDIPCMPNLKQIQYLPSDALPMYNDALNSPYELGDLVYLPKGNKYCSGYYLCVRKPLYGVGGLLVHLCLNEPGDDETINLDGDNDGCWYPYNKSKGMATEKSFVKAYLAFLLNNKATTDNLKCYLDGKIVGRQPTLKDKKSHIFPEGFGNDNGYVYKSSDGRGARIRYDAAFGSYAWVPAYHYRISYYWYVPSYCDDWQYVADNSYTYVYDSDWEKHAAQYWNFTMNVITFENSPVPGAKIEYSPTKDTLTFLNDADYVAQEHLGQIYASNHRIYETVSKARAAGQTPIGVIVYVNDGSEFGNMVTEADEGYGHALVLALKNINGNPNLQWAPSNALDEYAFEQYVDQSTGAAAALSDFGGLYKTSVLAADGSPAAKAAIGFGMEVAPPEPKASKWFLPSAAQWLAMLCKPGLGGMPMPLESADFPTYVESGTKKAFDNINAHMKGNGVYTIGAGKYWSSSAYNATNGVYLTCLTYGTRLTYWRNTTAKVRSVLVF